MPFEHVIDKALGEVCVRLVAARQLAVLKNHVIDHGQRRYQLRPRALRQQRPVRVGYFDHQQLAGLARLAETLHVLGEQRIELAGDPARGAILQPHFKFVERNDFRPGVQKQSLSVVCRFANGPGVLQC